MGEWNGSYGTEKGPMWTLVKIATDLGIPQDARRFLAR